MTRSVPSARRPAARLALQALAVALLLVGCSTAGAAPSAVVAPSPTVEPAGSDGVPSGMETEQGEIDPPIDYTPDQFWAMMTSQPDFMPRTDSLGKAFQAAELIVVGQAVDVVEAGGYGEPGGPTMWYAEAVIEVSEVLKGKPALDRSGRLHIPFVIGLGLDDTYPEHVLKDFQRAMDKGPALLLLKSWATHLESTGSDVPTWFDGLSRTDLYLTIGPEGAMRVTEAGVQPPLAEGWAQDLAVTPLAQLKDQISAAPAP